MSQTDGRTDDIIMSIADHILRAVRSANKRSCNNKNTKSKTANRKFVKNEKLSFFLARDSIYAIARYMPSPVRPSVWPSVCPSVCLSHGWISQRRL